MRTLNLAYPEKTDIQFEISRFPDGQQTVDIKTPKKWLNSEDIKILARITTFRDLEIIIAANQVLREMAVSSVHLYVAYFKRLLVICFCQFHLFWPSIYISFDIFFYRNKRVNSQFL